ncbi:hypothetical protein J6V85_02535 [Candidatus Saccharibacteria bacterium]|nr:hypothetical protein [Candidatus Saccharibacteria bacterium]
MKKRGRPKFKIKTWQLILILIPVLFLDATLLRMDHIKMTKLRDAVLAADEAENDEEIARTLDELKKFVFSNIVINIVEDNGTQRITFGTGPFYLEHQYIRAANAALKEAESKLRSDDNPNGNVYALASDVCSPLAAQNGWTWNDSRFINCMLTEINKYPATDEIQDKIIASLPSTELYRKNYASPIFVPTLTGFMLLVTAIIIVVIFIRFLIWLILRLSLLFV